MIEIDGSHGEGGGQIIRTSLALSIITGKPFRVRNIRANRDKPGLKNQHLTCVNAAQAISSAEVEGAALNSSAFSFSPKQCQPGKYHFSIATAGSTLLVLQTILPPLMLAKEPSTITLEGGTHNEHAPPFDFVHTTFLPVLKQMGVTVDATLERMGFYPPGGGKLRVTITPNDELKPLHILERSAVNTSARVILVKLPRHIAERELQIAQKALSIEKRHLHIDESSNAVSPGNVVLIELASEHVTETVTSIGKRGVQAEQVAKSAVDEARRYLDAKAPVGEHLADQLIIPFALAGDGSFVTIAPSMHTTTNIEIVKRFLDVSVTIDHLNEDQCKIMFSR